MSACAGPATARSPPSSSRPRRVCLRGEAPVADGEVVESLPADVGYEGGDEDGDALSRGPSNRGVDDASYGYCREPFPEFLSMNVAVGIKTCTGRRAVIAEVSEVLTMDVGEEESIWDVRLFSQPRFLEVPDAVECDFREARVQVKGAIPGTPPVCGVEPCAFARIGEGGVDDLGERQSEGHVCATETVGVVFLLGLKATVGDGGQLHERGESVVVIAEGGQRVLGLLGIPARDETVRVVARDLCHSRPDGWASHRPPRRPSSRVRTSTIAGIPPSIIACSGVLPRKIGLVLGRAIQESASSPG